MTRAAAPGVVIGDRHTPPATRTPTAMRRRVAAVALALALAPVACSPVESVVATERIADAGDVGGTWVLRRVDGAPLPARVQESAEGWAELLADTLRFDADSVRTSGLTRIVARGTATPHDAVHTQRVVRGYRVADGQVRIGDVPCGEPRELILCAPPDTGRVHGDTLALTVAMPDQPRRAYVRIAPR